MRIEIRPSRRKLTENRPHTLDTLVTLHAPEVAPNRTRPPLCIVPVVDVSGSMQGKKLASVCGALAQLARHLAPGDRLGLVVFDSEVRTLMPPVELTRARRGAFLRHVRGLRAGSNTNLGDGLAEAVRQIRGAALARNERARVILLTDGLANEGPATSREQLVALTSTLSDGVTISAFGYGADCDQVVLGEMAEAGGGSYAFIENDDQVLSAFARELGGLTATHASDVRVELGNASERLGDLLYGAELSWLAQCEVPQHWTAEAVEVATVRVSFRDELGRDRVESAPLHVDFVPAGLATKEDDAAVLRARWEQRLARAQERAEEHARRGEWTQAHQCIVEVADLVSDPALRKYAKEMIAPLYGGEEEYSVSSGSRSMSRSALKRKRQLVRSAAVDATFRTSESSAESEMEGRFRGKND